MKTPQFTSEALRRFFQEKKIGTLEELRAALGHPARATVFRKLGELEYLSSYTHRGKYYTLRSIARFGPVDPRNSNAQTDRPDGSTVGASRVRSAAAVRIRLPRASLLRDPLRVHGVVNHLWDKHATKWLASLWDLIAVVIRSRAALQVENLAPRHQLAVLHGGIDGALASWGHGPVGA